jgi:hypothetical protein
VILPDSATPRLSDFLEIWLNAHRGYDFFHLFDHHVVKDHAFAQYRHFVSHVSLLSVSSFYLLLRFRMNYRLGFVKGAALTSG